MLSMAEKTFLGLAVILSFTLAGVVVLPVFTYQVRLVTSPNTEKISLPAKVPFNITCRGSGDDANKFASLKWLNKDGNVIPEGIPGTIVEKKNSLTLAFTEPKETDSGVYKCVGVYEKNDDLQKSISITFHGTKPIFEEDYENMTAVENAFLELVCAAEGESPIKYEWYNMKDEQFTQDSKQPIYVSNIINASVLKITNVSLNDGGSYVCLASNQHGLSSKIFELTVIDEGSGSTIETTSFRSAGATNVTSTSVRFIMNVTGPVTKIQVKYNESRNATEYIKEFKFGNFYEIKDLIPAGLYDFKFKTFPTTSHEWSRPHRVVMLPNKPEVTFRRIDSGTVKLDWFFKFEDRMRKTIDRHEISYYTVQQNGIDNWERSTCAITIQIPECTASVYTLSGLSLRVYYEIQLRAHTASGYSEPYTQRIFMGDF